MRYGLLWKIELQKSNEHNVYNCQPKQTNMKNLLLPLALAMTLNSQAQKIEGVVTYHFNDNIGNVADVGASVYIIPCTSEDYLYKYNKLVEFPALSITWRTYQQCLDNYELAKHISKAEKKHSFEYIAPALEYETKINVHNVTAIRKENDEIQMKINDIYPNANKSNKVIIYRAINAYPQSGNLEPEVYQRVIRN